MENEKTDALTYVDQCMENLNEETIIHHDLDHNGMWFEKEKCRIEGMLTLLRHFDQISSLTYLGYLDKLEDMDY